MTILSSLVAQAGVAGEAARSGYQIERSLRFNSADSAYLNRTPAVAGNRRTFTLSFWIKSGSLAAGTTGQIMGTTVGTFDRINFGENSTAQLSFTVDAAGTSKSCLTPGVYRDPSAWYHFVVAVDTTQATDTNRVKIYANGVQQTLTGTFPNLDYQSSINNNVAQHIGSDRGSTFLFNGYMTEINFIDGQALDETNFGEFNAATGVWQPKAYSGSYGTNGFYLNFSDNSGTTSTTLGKDQAGSNNWTPNLFSVTAGAGNDSLVDTPTNYGTDTGVGGEVRGNYATMNPLDQAGGLLFAEGNLKVTAATGWDGSRATFSYPSTGKWYWEALCVSRSTGASVGILSTSAVITGDLGAAAAAYVYNSGDGNKYNGGVNLAYGATWTTNDLIGIAWDADTGTLSFYKYGVSQGTAYSGLSGQFSPAIGVNGSDSMQANFGNRPFAYTAPSGFKALCTQNLPDPPIMDGSEYFDVVTYNGNGANVASGGQTISSLDFRPDWVWIKKRTGTPMTNHALFDVVRGANLQLQSNNTFPEFSMTEALVSFTGNGFTLGNSSNVNLSSNAYVAWNWAAGGEPTANNNSDGNIISTVSVNTTSGFAIVTYTGTGANATVGHGLGVAPSIVIVKSRSLAGENWIVGHTSLGFTNQLNLNTTANSAVSTNFNSTTPTSSVFSIGSGTAVNSNTNTYVAYCFAAIPGYSAFGSYTGNGLADGPLVHLGFKPAFVMIKNADASGDWFIYDTARNTYNVSDSRLKPNLADAEGTGGSFGPDILSNGFKMRSNFNEMNGSGNKIIYAAFALNPFKYSLAR